MSGYYRDPEAIATAFVGGWFHSGDLGVMHPDGYIELRDRAKDVIISGGENISTVEVEHAVAAYPRRTRSRRRRGPRPSMGRTPQGLRRGPARSINQRSRRPRARALPDRSLQGPREIELVDALPKASTGKVQKFELRNTERAGTDT